MNVQTGIATATLLLGFLTAAPSGAQSIVLKRKGQEPELVDSARFNRVSKEYIVRKSENGVTVTYPEHSVDYCRPPKPAGFDAMKSAEELETVIKEHGRLWWDVEAFKRLMPLYIEKGDHSKAIQLFRDMKPVLNEAMPPAIHRAHWQALMNTKQTATLEKELTAAVTSGPRELAAWAYIMRGDVLAGQDKRQALLDGYLKAVLMFDDVKSCRRDALEKTIAAMRESGDSRSDKFRKMLDEEFPSPSPPATSFNRSSTHLYNRYRELTGR